MADVYVTCTVSPCTVVHQIDLPILNLDVESATQISSAILLVWVVGWTFRQFIRLINFDGDSSSESE